jgi:hypothetical protein
MFKSLSHRYYDLRWLSRKQSKNTTCTEPNQSETSFCWSIRQDSTLSDGNASRSQNEYIGIISGSLYTQANERGIEECMG